MEAVKPRLASEAQPTADSEGPVRELWTVIIVFSLVAIMTILAGVVAFSHFGASFLERRYDAVGEVLMKEGDRLAAAGFDDRALERYEKALQARFAGAFNRSHTLKCAGRILAEQGRLDKAIEYLNQAVTGAHADHSAYFYLVDALLDAGRVEEAERQNNAWMSLPQTRTRARDHGRALFYAARIAEARGNIEEAIQLSEKSYDVRAQAYITRYIEYLRRQAN